MDSKEYKISEIVDDIWVSKVTVYNKISNLKWVLRNHIKIRKGIKYIDAEGLEIIKNSIGLSKEKFKGLNEDYKEADETLHNTDVSNHQESLETTKRYIESLESQIEYLKNDNKFLKELLDKETGSKNKQLEAKDQLLQNFQVLLEQEQEKIRCCLKHLIMMKREVSGISSSINRSSLGI